MNGTTEIDVVRVQVTTAERAAGVLEPDRFERARQAMLDDGMVVLDDVVPVEIVDKLADRMAADLPALLKTAEGRPRHYAGQLNQPPPTDREFLFPEVLANPVVTGLCRSLLGEALFTSFYESNVNMPGSVAQAVHCDLPQLWPDLKPVHTSPYGIVCNLPLIDTCNGNATELWPGTHVDGRTYTRDEFHRDIPLSWLEERRRTRPLVQVAQRKGSVVLRDVRLWHTGVANTSGQVRTMIGIGYAPAWYNGFVIPIVDAVAEVLTELGIPPVSAANGTVAFIEQLGNARRKRA